METLDTPHIRAGMVGLGMIFDETYRPLFESARREPLFSRATGPVELELVGVASRTGSRVDGYRQAGTLGPFSSFNGPDAVRQLLAHGVDAVCVATPDDRHFEPARLALAVGKHVLIEKPSVLSLRELDQLQQLAVANGVLAKVVYHKLADPDHKKLRTHVADGILRHVNSGYCSLLEPKSISTGQFAEWIVGRNPASYVAVHYLKLIDFSFAFPPLWRLSRISATGQRGLVGPGDGPTWDSVLLQVIYTHTDGREAAFDIHTNWVTPDNFPGYVEQEVQFRFDNGVWLAHQRKRGVELTVEGRSPAEFKYTPNHHYNTSFLEPWGDRAQRGYGIEVIRRFFEEVAFVEYGGPNEQRAGRVAAMRGLTYNDIAADRNTVGIIQALEAILLQQRDGRTGSMVLVNEPDGGLVLLTAGSAGRTVLYAERV